MHRISKLGYVSKSILSLMSFVHSIHSGHGENRDQRIRQVVAYNRSKTMENHHLQEVVLN